LNSIYCFLNSFTSCLFNSFVVVLLVLGGDMFPCFFFLHY
jgi:hypothetical protein